VNRRAFTLIEMLMATALTALLLGAVLSVASALARDARRARPALAPQNTDAAFDQLRWDIANASSMSASRDGRELVLIGHGGIDSATMRPTGRLARVAYQSTAAGLVRRQEYLDDPAHPQAWSELLLAGASGIAAEPASLDLERASEGIVNIRIELSNVRHIEQVIGLR
jgi:prepilin-type N-terminal cleavage/methylation domain-containing protein